MKKTKAVLLVMMLLCFTAQVWAEHVLFKLSDFSADTLRDDYTGTIGFKFVVGSEDAMVDMLGFIDMGTDGLAQGHLLRIWDDAANVVVAEATVPAGTTTFKQDGFRYVPVNGGLKVLKAAKTYVFSAELISGGGDQFYNDNVTVQPNTYFVGSNVSSTWSNTWGVAGAKPTGYWHSGTSYGFANIIAKPLQHAHDPEVIDNGPNGSDASVTLKWKTALNAAETGVNPNVTKHYLYIANDEPNLASATPITITAGSAQAERTIDVAYETQKYWKVKESILNSAPTDGNSIDGPVWTFKVSALAKITQQPQDAFILPSQTATFTVDATSFSPIANQWYRSSDNLIDPSDTAVGTGDASYTDSVEGFYYCTLTNEGGVVSTNVVRLVVKRLMAHWTMNQSDFVANQYKDVSTEDAVAHNADPNVPGAVTFAAGPYSLGTKSAVPINDNSFATVSTALDPTIVSEQVTISAWIRLTGTLTEADGYGILTKGNGVVGNYENNIRWAFYARNRSSLGSVRLTSWNGGDVWSDPNTVPTNEWVHVAASVAQGRVANVYINGVQNGYTDNDFVFGGTAADPVRIGRFGEAGNNFPGEIDDIRIYNYGMDKYGIASLYSQGSGKNVCIDEYASTYDFVKDCKIDLLDFAEFAKTWLDCGLYPNCP